MRKTTSLYMMIASPAALVGIAVAGYSLVGSSGLLVAIAALCVGATLACALVFGGIQSQRAKALEARLGEDLRLFRSVQEITSDETLTLDQQINYLLDAGRKLLGLPLAIVSEIDGDDYRVCHVRSPDGAPPVGTRFPLGDTYCSHTLKAGKPTGFHHAGRSEINCHPCYVNFKLESYIGMSVQVEGKPFGTLNFSSPDARPEPFDERDYEFLGVLAYWIGSRLTEKASQRKSRKLSQALQYAVEGISYVDPEGRYQSVNGAYAANTGYRPDDMLGMDWRKTVHPEDVPALEETYRRMLAEGRASAEARGIRKDGREFHKQVTLIAEFDDGGELVGHYCFMQDITEAVQARAAMARQQALFEALMRDTPDPMVICDLDRRIVAVNPAFTSVFDYQAEEVIGKTTAMFYPSEAEFEAQGRERFHLSAEEKRLPYEQQYRRKNGELFFSETVGTLLKDQAGIPLVFFGHIRDISERKRLEKLKEEFISTVSHELRTPLTSIRGALGLLAAGVAGTLSEDATKLTRVAERNSERLIRLINDILDMEKVSSGSLEVTTVPCAAIELVEQAVDANRGYAEKHSVNLHLEHPVDARIKVDPDRFEQVLSNLISNAVKFSPVGASVTVRMEQRVSDLRISVTDCGRGIPEAFKESVFERFRQADASDRREKAGTGLGLAISKALVELMDGRIDFDSAEGVGSCFWVELPLLETAVPDNNSSVARVLIVEDDPLTARFLSTVIGGDGYTVDLAHDAEEARAKLSEGQFDAVTIDPGLPDQNGLDLVQQLRDENSTVLPVLVVSSKSPSDEALEDPALALVDWLSKPVCHDVLLGRLKEALAGSRRPKILHVEDDRDIAETVALMGRGIGDFDAAYTLTEARRLLINERYDLVLLDLNLPDGKGWQLLPDIRQLPGKPAVVVFSSEELSNRFSSEVDSSLTKARTQNSQLVDTLSRVLAAKVKEKIHEH